MSIHDPNPSPDTVDVVNTSARDLIQYYENAITQQERDAWREILKRKKRGLRAAADLAHRLATDHEAEERAIDSTLWPRNIKSNP